MWVRESDVRIAHESGVVILLKAGSWDCVIDFDILGKIDNVSLIREGLEFGKRTSKRKSLPESHKETGDVSGKRTKIINRPSLRVKKVPGKNTLTLKKKTQND